MLEPFSSLADVVASVGLLMVEISSPNVIDYHSCD